MSTMNKIVRFLIIHSVVSDDKGYLYILDRINIDCVGRIIIMNQMSKYKKKYEKYKLSGKCKDSNLKQMKANIQKEQRTAYWQYIEKMICNIPVDDDKTTTSSKFPKKSIFLHKESKI